MLVNLRFGLAATCTDADRCCPLRLNPHECSASPTDDVAAGQRADLVLVSGDPLTDITATRAIERIWRGGITCDRHAFVASAAEAEQLEPFDAQLAKVVAAVRNPQRRLSRRCTARMASCIRGRPR
jgi:hypothetical protein